MDVRVGDWVRFDWWGISKWGSVEAETEDRLGKVWRVFLFNPSEPTCYTFVPTEKVLEVRRGG